MGDSGGEDAFDSAVGAGGTFGEAQDVLNAAGEEDEGDERREELEDAEGLLEVGVQARGAELLHETHAGEMMECVGVVR